MSLYTLIKVRRGFNVFTAYMYCTRSVHYEPLAVRPTAPKLMGKLLPCWVIQIVRAQLDTVPIHNKLTFRHVVITLKI